ncbi:MAG TPA: efflux RND transporter periplasmic adaptor subunit, partial [Devosia sp.]|nr:efflux RND transporter periplasmic adaptor subunit [Devosia sp.]
MRALFSYGVALVIVILIGVWLGTGTIIKGGQGPGLGEKPVISVFEPKQGQAPAANAQNYKPSEENEPNPFLTIAQREASTQGGATPARSVAVKTFTAEAMPIEVDVRGQTQAKASVTAAAETSGTVEAVNVQKGQTVKVGDLLCTLDPETRQAAVEQAQAGLAQAQANLAQAQADYDTNADLRAKGLATPNSERALSVALASAKAAVASAQAGLDNAKTELSRTKITAKSAGVVVDPVANVGSMLAAGQPCATIAQLDPIVFSGAVPEARIGYAKVGLPASVTTVTGDKLKGKVTYVSAVSDPATRTFAAEIELPNPGNKVQAGLSATATVDVGTAPAQLLPQSVLTLDDNGTMGVRAVDANSKVVFYPITIVKDAREGMYVTGLPPKVDIITV